MLVSHLVLAIEFALIGASDVQLGDLVVTVPGSFGLYLPLLSETSVSLSGEDPSRPSLSSSFLPNVHLYF